MSGHSSSDEPNAKTLSGDFDKFTDFMRKLVQVPHSEIKARIESDREVKRASKTASRASGASSKHP
jgi:hypothetical protein